MIIVITTDIGQPSWSSPLRSSCQQRHARRGKQSCWIRSTRPQQSSGNGEEEDDDGEDEGDEDWDDDAEARSERKPKLVNVIDSSAGLCIDLISHEYIGGRKLIHAHIEK